MKLTTKILNIGLALIIGSMGSLTADTVTCEGEPDGNGGTGTGVGPSRDLDHDAGGTGGEEFLLGEITANEKTTIEIRIEALAMYVSAMSKAVAGDDCGFCPDEERCEETLSGTPFPGGESTGVYTLDEEGNLVLIGYQVVYQ